MYADVNVKESVSLTSQSIENIVIQVEKCGADAIIVTGFETGKKANVEDVKNIRGLTNLDIFVGSGISEFNVNEYLKYAAGVIVGSSLKDDLLVSNYVSSFRVKKIMDSLKK